MESWTKMASFGNQKLISIELSKAERQFLLDNCEFGDTDLTNRIKCASDGTLRLMEHEADALKAALYRLTGDKRNVEQLDVLSTLVDKVVLDISTKLLFHHLPSAKSKSTIRPVRSLPEDLTSEQIVRFHDYSWGDAEFPLQFDHSLSLEEANRSVFFRNARLFLNTLIECTDQTTATAKKNLNRKLVRQMFDQMEIDEKHRTFLACCKVLNEKDVFSLHLIRIICECAGLIKYHSQTFVVPKKHCALLSEDTAGELYYLLFHAYFNKFNMSYVDGLPEVGGLQGGCDYSLYRIGMLCDGYQSVDDLFPKVLLPIVLEEIEYVSIGFMRKESFLTSRILDPLVRFGLLEAKYEEDKYLKRMKQVRRTPLFDRFISVNL
jgi:hypothetical protein